MNDDEWLDRVRRLNTNQNKGFSAPHKPLLLLLAISRLEKGQELLPFRDIEGELERLLKKFGPAVKNVRPRYPYWNLQKDDLWQVLDENGDVADLPLTENGDPGNKALHETTGRLPPALCERLQVNPQLKQQFIDELLYEYFPRSRHDSLQAETGFTRPEALVMQQLPGYWNQRDSEFSSKVLAAYSNRCAATGFSVEIGGKEFCEAAYVRKGGPDTVANGLALEPGIHKMFDMGVWTLTDERRILVSSTFRGSPDAMDRLRSLHGQPIRSPLPGQPPVATEYIRWHREPELGGVFRGPSL